MEGQLPYLRRLQNLRDLRCRVGWVVNSDSVCVLGKLVREAICKIGREKLNSSINIMGKGKNHTLDDFMKFARFKGGESHG